jgi:hypothetical protein
MGWGWGQIQRRAVERVGLLPATNREQGRGRARRAARRRAKANCPRLRWRRWRTRGAPCPRPPPPGGALPPRRHAAAPLLPPARTRRGENEDFVGRRLRRGARRAERQQRRAGAQQRGPPHRARLEIRFPRGTMPPCGRPAVPRAGRRRWGRGVAESLPERPRGVADELGEVGNDSGSNQAPLPTAEGRVSPVDNRRSSSPQRPAAPEAGAFESDRQWSAHAPPTAAGPDPAGPPRAVDARSAGARSRRGPRRPAPAPPRRPAQATSRHRSFTGAARQVRCGRCSRPRAAAGLRGPVHLPVSAGGAQYGPAGPECEGREGETRGGSEGRRGRGKVTWPASKGGAPRAGRATPPGGAEEGQPSSQQEARHAYVEGACDHVVCCSSSWQGVEAADKSGGCIAGARAPAMHPGGAKTYLNNKGIMRGPRMNRLARCSIRAQRQRRPPRPRGRGPRPGTRSGRVARALVARRREHAGGEAGEGVGDDCGDEKREAPLRAATGHEFGAPQRAADLAGGRARRSSGGPGGAWARARGWRRGGPRRPCWLCGAAGARTVPAHLQPAGARSVPAHLPPKRNPDRVQRGAAAAGARHAHRRRCRAAGRARRLVTLLPSKRGRRLPFGAAGASAGAAGRAGAGAARRASGRGGAAAAIIPPRPRRRGRVGAVRVVCARAYSQCLLHAGPGATEGRLPGPRGRVGIAKNRFSYG